MIARLLTRLVAQASRLGLVAQVLRRPLRGPLFAPIVAGAGACLLVTLLSLITAFAAMPIATAIPIFCVEPLLLTLLPRPMPGGRVGPRRHDAVAVGRLVGALIVIRPNVALCS